VVSDLLLEAIDPISRVGVKGKVMEAWKMVRRELPAIVSFLYYSTALLSYMEH
jgi:hypothetical protein